MLRLLNFRMTQFFMSSVLYCLMTSEPDLAPLVSNEDKACSARRNTVSVPKIYVQRF